jgi:hypothetical protein
VHARARVCVYVCVCVSNPAVSWCSCVCLCVCVWFAGDPSTNIYVVVDGTFKLSQRIILETETRFTKKSQVRTCVVLWSRVSYVG